MDGAVGEQPPRVDEVPHHAPLVGEGLSARAVQLAAAAAHAVDHLRAARPQAYHRVHAELGHVLLAFGPRGVHALQRAPQRRRVHVAPRGDAQHDVVPAADAQLQHRGQRNLRVPAGPHVRQQVQAGLPRVAAALHKAQVRQHAVHGLNAVRRAQDGQGEGGVGQPVAPAAHHVHADVQRVRCARLRLKNQRRQLGAPDVLHDAGGHAALQTRGLRALSQRLRCGSRRTAPAKFARCPQRPASPAPRGPARRRRQPAAAQRALAVLRGQGLLPLRRAGHLPLRLQQLQKNLVRQAGQALAPVLLVERLAPPPQHQPQPAVLRRAADGHLGALADGHELPPRLAQVLAPEQPGCTSAASKRLHSWMGGRACLASPR